MIKNWRKSQIILLLMVVITISFFRYGLAQEIKAIPPSNPEIGVVGGDGYVKIYWNSKPESDVDSVLKALYPDTPSKWNNFEGYKIYRATDYRFEEVHTITDGLGEISYYKPLAVFDRINNIEGYFKGNSGLGIPLIFTNESENTFAEALPPFYPNIQPMKAGAELLNESTAGIWTIHISDSDTSKNIGQLINWKIGFKQASDTSYTNEVTGTIDDLNVVENPGFDEYENGSEDTPASWERYQPETMFFTKAPNRAGDGYGLQVTITDFWDEGTKNRLSNGDFEQAGDTTGWDQLLDDSAVNLSYIDTYKSDDEGWLKMDVMTDTTAGIRWNIETSSQFEANSWVAITIKVAGENVPADAELYLDLNNGVEKRFSFGSVPTDTTVLHYYRKLNTALSSVSVFVRRAQGATLYFDKIRATTAEYITQEVYQRMPRVIAGASYEWKTKFIENDPSIKVTPGYRVYRPDTDPQGRTQDPDPEYRQYGFETSSDDPDYQYFSRSFTAPVDMQDGLFFYTVDVIADEWDGEASFFIDSLTMIGNSKWGLNLYSEVSSSVEFPSDISFDDYAITLDISHPWLYEIAIELEAPSGNRYTLMDGLEARSYMDGASGLAQYLGSNSGLEYTYIDTSVNNGQRYFYAVVAYDHGDSLYNILPSEGTMTIKIENGQYVFDENTAMVIPNPYIKGYTPPKIQNDSYVHEGPATGTIDIEIVDPAQVQEGAEYEVYFYDTVTDTSVEVVSTKTPLARYTTAYGILNYTTGDTIIDYNVNLTQPSLVFNGVRLNLHNDANITILTDSIRWFGSDLSHPNVAMRLSEYSGKEFPVKYKITFYDTTQLNQKGVPFRVYDLIEDKPVKFGYSKVSGKKDFNIFPFYEDYNDSMNINFPYKSNYLIQLQMEGEDLIASQQGTAGGLYFWQDIDSTVNYAVVTGFGNIPPRTIGSATKLFWADSLVPDPSNPKYVILETDTIVTPGLYSFKGYVKASSDQKIIFESDNESVEYTVTTSYNDPALDLQLNVTCTGKLRLVWESTGQDEVYFFDISIEEQYQYKEGDYLIAMTTVPFRSTDYFRFSTSAAGINTDAEANWDKFTVVPNPYIVSSSWDYSADLPGEFPNKISFVNVPVDATIRIYTVRGDLVRKLVHSQDIFDGTIDWNLKNRYGKDVAYGVYVYHIESQSIGNKVGKLAIIR